MENETGFTIAANGEVQADIRSLLAALPKKYDYIVFGDTNHLNDELIRFFDSPDFLEGLKQGGVTTIGREVEKERFTEAEALLNNTPPQALQIEASRNALFDTLLEKGYSAKRAASGVAIRAHGLNVANIDTDVTQEMASVLVKQGYSQEEAEKAASVTMETVYQGGRLWHALDKSMGDGLNLIANDSAFDAAAWNAVANPKSFYTVFQNRFEIADQRIEESNLRIAKNIKQHGSTPIAVIKGDGHMRFSDGSDVNHDGKIDAKEAGLDELLGDKTVYIAVYPSEADYYNKERTLVGDAFRYLTGQREREIKDTPDYIIFLDGNDGKGKIIKPFQPPKERTVHIDASTIPDSDILCSLSPQTSLPALPGTKRTLS